MHIILRDFTQGSNGLKKEYFVRPYQTDDEEKIVELLQLVFEGWPRMDLPCTSLEHWKWKYLDNPFRKNDVTVALNEDGIIGCKHSVPVNIKVENDVYFCNLGTDLGVHPEFRGLGISRKVRDLNEVLKKKCGYEFAYFVTSNPILIQSYLNHPRFPHEIVNLVRIRDIDEHLEMMPVENSWFMKLGFRTSSLFNNLKNVFDGSEFEDRDNKIREVQRFDKRIDSFWNSISEHYDFIVERRRDYLNWRYCDSRGGNFIVKQIEEEKELLGYYVMCINRYRREYPIGYIVDMLTPPDQPEIANALVADALAFFDEQNINIVNSMIVKGHPYERVLNRFGFLNSRFKIHVFFSRSMLRTHPNVIKKIKGSSANRLNFSYGDIDSLPATMPSYR